MHEPDARGSSDIHTARAGWRVKLPATPPRREDARLLQYRHPAERRMLALSLVALAILITVATLLERKPILLGLGGIWLAMFLASLQAVTYNMMRGAEVTPTQFPAIYRTMQELCQRFQAPTVRVFVVGMLNIRAQTLGFRAPYVIVLPALLLDALEPDELRFVLGQELGHIRFGHTRMALLLGGDESTLPALLSWIAYLRNLVFAGYWRTVALTGDRAGILACDNVRTALRAQIKLAVGTSQFPNVHGNDLVEQAYLLTQGMSRVQAKLIRLYSTTPPLILRLAAMVEWAGLPPREEER
jgi:Zn-dependent protease with chaperone function